MKERYTTIVLGATYYGLGYASRTPPRITRSTLRLRTARILWQEIWEKE